MFPYLNIGKNSARNSVSVEIVCVCVYVFLFLFGFVINNYLPVFFEVGGYFSNLMMFTCLRGLKKTITAFVLGTIVFRREKTPKTSRRMVKKGYFRIIYDI